MQRDRDYIPLWYIMDEVGSRVHHSDTPNFEFKAFYYMEQDITFTIIFPLQDLENGSKFGNELNIVFTIFNLLPSVYCFWLFWLFLCS